MKRLSRYFINGLIFTVPVILTIYIFYLVFTYIDSILRIPIPGVGFVSIIVIITLIGFLVSNFITRRLLYWFDDLMERLPLVKLIYSSVKDLINAFLGDKKTFSQPVMVRLSGEGSAHALGFITCDSLNNFGLDEYVAVYLPQSYNFAGNLVVFPKDHVYLLDANSSELMTFIVSGGVAASENRNGGETKSISVAKGE